MAKTDKLVYKVDDGWQDADGNPVTEDGTLIEPDEGDGKDGEEKPAGRPAPKKK